MTIRTKFEYVVAIFLVFEMGDPLCWITLYIILKLQYNIYGENCQYVYVKCVFHLNVHSEIIFYLAANYIKALKRALH